MNKTLKADTKRRGLGTSPDASGVAPILDPLHVMYAAMDYAAQCALHPHAAGGEVPEKDAALDKLRGLLGLLPDGVDSHGEAPGG